MFSILCYQPAAKSYLTYHNSYFILSWLSLCDHHRFRSWPYRVIMQHVEFFFLYIGNYGNKLDKSVEPSSSTTPPTNAIFDGCYYYYLPWGDTKPCISVDSHWEDISFRLDPLNILLEICEKLVGMPGRPSFLYRHSFSSNFCNCLH